MTACFAMMVGPEGRAVGVEHIPELVASSMENIKKSAAAPLLKEGSLSVHVGGTSFFFPFSRAQIFFRSRMENSVPSLVDCKKNAVKLVSGTHFELDFFIANHIMVHS